MQTICAVSRYSFASGAEEKIVRTFQAPANFIQNFRNLTATADDDDDDDDAIVQCRSRLVHCLLSYFYLDFFSQIATPKGASVPSLGLSNKAVYDESIPVAADERHIKDQYPDNYFVPITMNGKFKIFHSILHDSNTSLYL